MGTGFAARSLRFQGYASELRSKREVGAGLGGYRAHRDLGLVAVRVGDIDNIQVGNLGLQ